MSAIAYLSSPEGTLSDSVSGGWQYLNKMTTLQGGFFKPDRLAQMASEVVSESSWRCDGQFENVFISTVVGKHNLNDIEFE